MRYGDVTNYGSYDQKQTTEFFLKPAGDISAHFTIGYVNDGEIRYNTSIDRLEGHIRGDWSPFLLLDDFSECGGTTDDVIGQFVGACLNQCEYFATRTHTHSSGSSLTKTYDLWADVCNQNGLDINERRNFAIQPVMVLTKFKCHMHVHYQNKGVWNLITPLSKNRYSSDFGKFKVQTWLLEGSSTWTIAILANRMDAFKLECVDGTPPPPPPPPPDPVVLDVKSNVINFNPYEEVVDRYPLWNRVDPLNVVINIHEGVNVQGSSSGAGLIIEKFPHGSNVTVNNRGNIVGQPGDGGDGGGYTFDPTKASNVKLNTDPDLLRGQSGGTGIYARVETTINNFSTGTIAGGGGGGGGSEYVISFDGQIVGGTGGGGGSIGGLGGTHGRGWENKDSVAFEGDMFPTSYDGLPGNDSESLAPGGSQTTNIEWTLFDDQLNSIQWIDQPPVITTGVGGSGGGPGLDGVSGYTPALPAMGVILWTQHNLPQNQDTLTIGSDVFTFYNCPTDTNTCWDGSSRTRNKDLQCRFNSCPEPPALESFINKTDQSDTFNLEYEALRHVNDNPVVPLTPEEIDKNIKQGFLKIVWDPETDFSNVSEKIIISVQGDDANMFEISANGTTWSDSLDWSHNSFTKTHTCLFYVRGKPVSDMDQAGTFHADLSVSAFGLKKHELLDCDLQVKVPSPVMEDISWNTTHQPLSDIDNFRYDIVHVADGVTWSEAAHVSMNNGTSLVNLDSQTKMNKFRDWYSDQSAPEAWIGLDASGPTPKWVNETALDQTIKPVRWWTDDEDGLTGKVSLIGDELNDYSITHKLNYYITETKLPSLDFEWVDGDAEPTGTVSFKGRFIQNDGVTVSSDTLSIWSHDATPQKSSSVTTLPTDENTIDASVTFSFDDVPADSVSSSHRLTVSWSDPNSGPQQHVFDLIVHRVKGSIINIDVISSPHDYSYTYKNGPSDAKAFEIRGSYMYDDMDVGIGEHFEISIDQGTTWNDQHTITPAMNPQIVHARMKADLAYTGSESFTEYESIMTVQSPRAETKTTTLTGKVFECESKEITYTYDQDMWYDVTFDDMLETGTIHFDMWGASGGSGGKNDTAGVQGGRGGGGFYSEGSFTVEPGDMIRIQVGQGGSRGQSSSADEARGAGGWSGTHRGGNGGDYRTNDVSGGGGGGGASLIMKKPNNSSTWELIADASGGAGGGGAYSLIDGVTERGADAVIDYSLSDFIESKLQGLNFDITSAGYDYSNRSCVVDVRYNNVLLYRVGTGRSYQMVRLRRLADGEWIVIPNPSGRNKYDAYGNRSHAEALNNDLLASVDAKDQGWLEMILIGTNDEPSNNRDVFKQTLQTHFGSVKMGESFPSRCAYILAAFNDGTLIHEDFKDQYNGTGKWNSELTFRYGSSFTASGVDGLQGCGGGGAGSVIGGAAGMNTNTNRGSSAGEPQLLTHETRDTNSFRNASVPYLLPPKHRPMNHAANYAWYEQSNVISQPGLPGQSDFSRNGHPEENWTYIGTGPYGRQSVLWRCMNKDVSHPVSGSGGSHGDGGWNKAIDGLDPNKHHMSVVYVRRPSTRTGGTFYHGCQWNNTLNMDGTVNGNPYFEEFGVSAFDEGEWYLSVGFIWAKDTTVSPAPGLGGVYRLSDGSKIFGCREFRMLSTRQYHRTYLYYSGTQDPGNELEWAHPGFFQIDEIPTLDDLLAGDYFGIQGSFPTQLTPQNSSGRHGQVKLYFDCCKQDSYCINTSRTKPTAPSAPTINLNGSDDITMAAGGLNENFVDPGVVVTNGDLVGIRVHRKDAAYGFVTADPNTLTGFDIGEYAIMYQALNADGVSSSISRTLRIKDLAKPTITLIGDDQININTQTDFVDPGATATDALDGDITSSITSTLVGPAGLPATVENMKNFIGDYTLTYTARDGAGNTASVTRTVTVTDTTPPVITLSGENPLILEAAIHDSYTTPGATATDNTDGDISSSIVITHDIDFNTPGDYTATYTVTDNSGNQSSATRTITISDTTKPVITLTGDDPHYHFVGDNFVDPGVAANDPNHGTDLTDDVTLSDVNFNLAGTYTAKYNVSDSSGNQADEKTRSIVVVPGMNITTQINFIGFDSMSFQFSREATGITSDVQSETFSINGVTWGGGNPGDRHGLDYAHVGQQLYIGPFNDSGHAPEWAKWGEGLPKYLHGLISNTHINTTSPPVSHAIWNLEYSADVYYLRKDGWNEVEYRGKADGWVEVENWKDSEFGYTLSTYSADPNRSWRVYRNRFDPGVYQLDDYSAMWFFNPETPQITYRYELSTSDTDAGFDAGVVQTKTFNKFQTEVSFENLQPYTFYACRLTVEHASI